MDGDTTSILSRKYFLMTGYFSDLQYNRVHTETELLRTAQALLYHWPIIQRQKAVQADCFEILNHSELDDNLVKNDILAFSSCIWLKISLDCIEA